MAVTPHNTTDGKVPTTIPISGSTELISRVSNKLSQNKCI